MHRKIKKRLYRVTEDVLEKLAFMFSYPEDDREAIDRSSAIAVQVSFDGPFSGKLLTLITASLLPELAANMLGVENEDTTRDQQFDALKELQNIICGNLLPAIAGKQATFNVSTPEILLSSTAEATAAQEICMAKLSLEEGECDLYFYMDGGIPDELIVPEPDEEEDNW